MIRLCAFSDEASDSLEGQIAALKRNNIKLVELRSVDGVNVKDFTDEQAKTYAKRLEENDIRVWSLGSPLGKEDICINFAEYENTIRRVCGIARIFSCERIRVFSFYNAYSKSDKVFECMQKMVKIAGEYGLTLCHENEKGVYGDTAKRVRELGKNVRGLQFVFDPANYVQTGENVGVAIDELYDETAYFHIKDALRECGEIVPAGEGDGEIKKLISKISGDKVLTIEPHLALFKAYAQIDDTELKGKYTFSSNDESFDFAVKALKSVLTECGYSETNGAFEKNRKI